MAKSRGIRAGYNTPSGRSRTRAPRVGARIPVLILGEVRAYREGLERLLADEQDLQIVGVGAPVPEVLRVIAERRPRVVLIECGTLRASETVRAVAAASAGCRAIVLGILGDEDAVLRCASAGAAGFITSDASTAEIVESVVRAARGEVPCSSQIASILFRHVATGGWQPDCEPHLTSRERQVVSLIDRGLTNKEIASALSIGVATVKNHVHHILEKLRVSRRAAAAAKMRIEPSSC